MKTKKLTLAGRIILVVILLLSIMTVYTTVIFAQSRTYTVTIAQAYEDAEMMHPSKQQEYRDSVYEEVAPKRDALYNANAYNQWFFSLSHSFVRLLVVIAWGIVPMAFATPYVVAWFKKK